MKTKVTSIELIRFLAAISIVMFHFGSFYLDVDHYFPLSFIFVEFFFVLSGFFMMMHIAEKETPNTPLVYISRKVKGFFPIFALTFCVQYVIFILSNEIRGLGAAVSGLLHFKWEFLLLHGAGFIQDPQFGVDYLQGQTWYLSAMTLALVLAYPLALYFRKVFLYVVCPLSLVMIYSYIIQNLGTLNVGNEYFGVILAAAPRGFAGTCAGALSFCGYDHLKKTGLCRTHGLPAALIEAACYAAIAGLFLFGRTMAEEESLFYVFVFMVVVALACLNETPISRRLNKTAPRVLTYLGKLSLYLYLCHWNVVMGMKLVIPDLPWTTIFLLYIPIVLVYGILLKLLDEKRRSGKPIVVLCLLCVAAGIVTACIQG